MKIVAWRAQKGVASRSNTVARRSHLEHFGRTSKEIVEPLAEVGGWWSVTGPQWWSAGVDGPALFEALRGHEDGGMPCAQRKPIGGEGECVSSALAARQSIHGQDLVPCGGRMFHTFFIGGSDHDPENGFQTPPGD